MIFKRIAALVVAIGLVISAISLRKAIDDNSSNAATPGDTTDASTPSDIGEIVCVEDLRAVCAEFADVVIEPWSVTADRLAAGDEIAAWVTMAPFHTLVPEIAETEALNFSELTVLGRTDRADAYVAACDQGELWQCLGQVAGDPWESLGGQASWGSVVVGFPDPSERAIGALVLGEIGAAYFGGPGFSSRNIDADDGFYTWFGAFSDGVSATALVDPSALLIRRPSAVNLVADSSISVEAAVGARSGEYRSEQPASTADITIVIATTGEVTLGQLPAGLRDSLRAAAADGEPLEAVPAGGVSAATLIRMQQLWEETR